MKLWSKTQTVINKTTDQQTIYGRECNTDATQTQTPTIIADNIRAGLNPCKTTTDRHLVLRTQSHGRGVARHQAANKTRGHRQDGARESHSGESEDEPPKLMQPTPEDSYSKLSVVHHDDGGWEQLAGSAKDPAATTKLARHRKMAGRHQKPADHHKVDSRNKHLADHYKVVSRNQSRLAPERWQAAK